MLEKLHQRRVPPHALLTSELAARLAEVSAEMNRQVGLLLNRAGSVEYVVVGDAHRIELPDFKRFRTGFRRFRGLRCVHTHLDGTGLSQEDLTDLALLRLDTMSVLGIDDSGAPGLLHTAHVKPAAGPGGEQRPGDFWVQLPPVPVYRLDLDFSAFIRDLEAEFTRSAPGGREGATAERAILVGVTTGGLETERSRLEELRELARSADAEVLDVLVQRRPKLDPRHVMGEGKLREIIIRGMQLGAGMLIFNRNLSPTQARAICRETDMKVIDRTQLILDIFARRARSQEGKIQVELAQFKYLFPRLAEADDSLSRLTGGIGGRGPGETVLEVGKRRIRDRIAFLEDKLEGIRKARAQRRRRRSRRAVPVVSIVGYTNAGKSTLFNRLARADALAEDKLFATLDPLTRQLRFPGGAEAILADTVGFIRDLPKELLEAFKATLEEIEEADLIVHLADAAAPDRDTQVHAVEDLLRQLELDEIPRLSVWNKADLLQKTERDFLARRGVVLSALTGEGVDSLLVRLRDALFTVPGSALPNPLEVYP